MKRGYYYIIPAVAAVVIAGIVAGVNAYLNADDERLMERIQRDRSYGANIDYTGSEPVRTGNLTVFILPYTKMDAGSAMSAIESIVGMRLRDDHRSGASLKGQYDNYGNILAPSSTVRFVIDPTLKKPDGSPVRVEDLDEEFLFGNNLTVGGVGFKDGSGVGATILVVDSHYEDAIKAKLDDIRVALTGRS
ncbi:MAG: hypothetical protein RMJ59_07125 [Candidatus Nitrosocaldus sp.]|nr:hypothetical protein [Candidatus Nitrosocaldus sp.]MDW8276130.1 hypothetical protein [Candidatus Nitrosocaldus sp.]